MGEGTRDSDFWRKNTHQVLRDAVDKVGVKKVAAALDVSTSLVYKWCQPPKNPDSPDASGVTNPLDRLLRIFELTTDLDLLHFLCRSAGGYFTPNPEAHSVAEASFIKETVEILTEFASLMRGAENSLSDDGKIDEDEAAVLRKNWDRLKSRLEHFVGCCEDGVFNSTPSDSKDAK